MAGPRKIAGRRSVRLFSPDLSASVYQSAADELLQSVSYPFTLLDQHYPFMGLMLEGQDDDQSLTAHQIRDLLKDADALQGVTVIPRPADSPHDEFLRDVAGCASELIQDAKETLLDVDTVGYSGPSPQDLKSWIGGGIKGIAKFPGIEFKAHLAWLKVLLRVRPTVGLNSPRIDVTNVDTLVSATGELWAYVPTIENWKIVWKWKSWASVTVRDVKVRAAAHAELSATGSSIRARAVADRLRLNYDILNLIPLEDFATQSLSNHQVPIFDGSQYVTTSPLLNSRFTVAGIQLPPSKGLIEVHLLLRRV